MAKQKAGVLTPPSMKPAKKAEKKAVEKKAPKKETKAKSEPIIESKEDKSGLPSALRTRGNDNAFKGGYKSK